MGSYNTKDKKYNVIMLPTPEKQLGLPMLCVKKTGAGIEPGHLGFCHSEEWFNINGVKYWQPQHLYFVSNEKIQKGDCVICNFGKKSSIENVIGIVHEINSDDSLMVKYFDETRYDERDKIRGYSNWDRGYQNKIIASTNKRLGLEDVGKAGYLVDEFHTFPWITESFVRDYCKAYNDNNKIKEVVLWMEKPKEPERTDDVHLNAILFDQWLDIKDNFYPRTKEDGSVSIVSQSKIYSKYELKRFCKKAIIDTYKHNVIPKDYMSEDDLDKYVNDWISKWI